MAALLQQKLNVEINVDSLLDVQIKRIHEYKRQLLNLLHVVTLYNRMRNQPDASYVPRTVIFGGKAAPGYSMAKLTIKLINDVADIVNNDPRVGGRLKVVFVPNYDVSTAEDIIPAADLSQQISIAGTEASGTGNIKLALNGALTIGTLDGANIEIRNEVGEENIFIFGLTAEGVSQLRAQGYNSWDYFHANAELREVLDMIGSGYFSPDEPGRFKPVMDALLRFGDNYLLLADYAAYTASQQDVETAYRDQQQWVRKAILNTSPTWESSPATAPPCNMRNRFGRPSRWRLSGQKISLGNPAFNTPANRRRRRPANGASIAGFGGRRPHRQPFPWAGVARRYHCDYGACDKRRAQTAAAIAPAAGVDIWIEAALLENA